MTRPVVSTREALRRLSTGRWLVSYPHIGPNGRRSIEREGATLRSFGLVWADGTELRTRGVKFRAQPGGRRPQLADGALAAYDETGYRFASYTPIVDLDDSARASLSTSGMIEGGGDD